MKNVKFIITFLTLALTSLTGLHAEPSPNNHVAPGKVYIYKTFHGQPQKLEVYFPEKSGGGTNKEIGRAHV